MQVLDSIACILMILALEEAISIFAVPPLPRILAIRPFLGYKTGWKQGVFLLDPSFGTLFLHAIYKILKIDPFFDGLQLKSVQKFPKSAHLCAFCKSVILSIALGSQDRLPIKNEHANFSISGGLNSCGKMGVFLNVKKRVVFWLVFGGRFCPPNPTAEKPL